MTGFKLKATLFGVPILFVIIVFGLVNIKPLYKVEAILVYEQQAHGKLDGKKLRNFNRSYRRFVVRNYRATALASAQQQSEIVEVLRSRDYAAHLIKHKTLKPLLFPNRWDEKAQKWLPPKTGVLGVVLSLLRENSYRKVPLEPLDWRAIRKIRKAIRLTINKKNGLLRLSIRWPNAEDGYIILSAFVDYMNDYFTLCDRRRLSAELKRLRLLTQTQSLPGMKKVLFNQIEFVQSQLQLKNPDFSSKVSVLSPPYVPERRTLRVPIVLMALSAVLGFMSSGLYILYQLIDREEINKGLQSKPLLINKRL